MSVEPIFLRNLYTTSTGLISILISVQLAFFMSSTWKNAMDFIYLAAMAALAGLAAAGLLVYLVAALLDPEDFS